MKWLITIAAGVGLAILGLTAHWWVPTLKAFAVGHHDVVEPLNDLTDLVWRIVGSSAGLVLLIYGLWQRKELAKAGTTVAAEHVHAGHDVNVAGGNVQTGGASVGGQGPTSVSGPVAGRDAIGSQTIIYQQAAATSFSPLHQLRAPPA